MAVGTLVLGGIAVGPAVAIGGFVLASQGEKALTRATEYAAQVDTAVARMEALIAFHHRAEVRVKELRSVAAALNARATHAIEHVAEIADGFDEECDDHVARLSLAMLLSKALSELLQIKVFDAEGMLTSESEAALAGYRRLVEEN